MLSKAIRTVVNRWAHAVGTAHGETARMQAMAELEAMREAGANHDDLLAHARRLSSRPGDAARPLRR